jgi:hypothetical protein
MVMQHLKRKINVLLDKFMSQRPLRLGAVVSFASMTGTTVTSRKGHRHVNHFADQSEGVCKATEGKPPPIL